MNSLLLTQIHNKILILLLLSSLLQVRHKLLQHINNNEKTLRAEIEKGTAPPNAVTGTEIDIDDVEYLMSDLWHNQCMITDERLGHSLELIKWDVTKPASIDNLVLMSGKGLKLFKKGKENLDLKIVERIEKRLDVARALQSDSF